MKKYKNKFRTFPILFFVIVFFGIHNEAIGAVITSQTTYTNELNETMSGGGSNGTAFYERLPLGIDGNLGGLILTARTSATTPTYQIVIIECNSETSCPIDGSSSQYWTINDQNGVRVTHNITNNIDYYYSDLTYAYGWIGGVGTTTINLNPAKYYAIEIDFNYENGKQTGFLGNATDTYTNGVCKMRTTYPSVTDCPDSMADMYFILYDTEGSPITSNISEFTSVIPYNNQSQTNPNVTFTANWNITTEDYEKLDGFLTPGVAGKVRLIVNIREAKTNLKQTWACTIINWVDDIGYVTSTSTTYLFTGDTNTCNGHLDYDNDYQLTWWIGGSKYAGIFGNEFEFGTTTYFTVGSTTNAGNVSTFVASSTQEELLGMYSNGYSLNACNPISSDFNIVDCLLFLLYPDTGYITKKIGEQYNLISHSFPIGYVTDFVNIVSSTSTTEITSMTGTIPAGIPGAGATFNIGLSSTSLSSLLYATTGTFITTTENDTDTFYDITSYYWNIIVGVLFVLYIIKRVLGITFTPPWEKTGYNNENAELAKYGLIRGHDKFIRKRNF